MFPAAGPSRPGPPNRTDKASTSSDKRNHARCPDHEHSSGCYHACCTSHGHGGGGSGRRDLALPRQAYAARDQHHAHRTSHEPPASDHVWNRPSHGPSDSGHPTDVADHQHNGDMGDWPRPRSSATSTDIYEVSYCGSPEPSSCNHDECGCGATHCHQDVDRYGSAGAQEPYAAAAPCRISCCPGHEAPDSYRTSRKPSDTVKRHSSHADHDHDHGEPSCQAGVWESCAMPAQRSNSHCSGNEPPATYRTSRKPSHDVNRHTCCADHNHDHGEPSGQAGPRRQSIGPSLAHNSHRASHNPPATGLHSRHESHALEAGCRQPYSRDYEEGGVDNGPTKPRRSDGADRHTRCCDESHAQAEGHRQPYCGDCEEGSEDNGSTRPQNPNRAGPVDHSSDKSHNYDSNSSTTTPFQSPPLPPPPPHRRNPNGGPPATTSKTSKTTTATTTHYRPASEAFDLERGPPPPDSTDHGVVVVGQMDCSTCARKVERAMDSHAGISNTRAVLGSRRAEFDVDVTQISVDDAVRHLTRATGFPCERLLAPGGGVVDQKGRLVRELAVFTEDLVGATSMLTLNSVEGLRLPGGVIEVVPVRVESSDSLGSLIASSLFWWWRPWEKNGEKKKNKKQEGPHCRIVYDLKAIGPRDVIERTFGKRLRLAPAPPDQTLAMARRDLRQKLLVTIISALLTLPVLVIAFAPLPGKDDHEGQVRYGAVSLAFATLVQFLVAGPIYVSVYKAVVHARLLEMDSLVVLSTTAGYVFSVVSYALLAAGRPLAGASGQFFFETSTLLVTLVKLGRYVAALAEQKAVESVSSANKKKKKGGGVFSKGEQEQEREREREQPKTAVLVTTATAGSAVKKRESMTIAGARRESRRLSSRSASGKRMIDARLLQLGDTFRVEPGEVVVSDGTVTAGASEVDESILTGESAPVRKTPGSPVIAGSVNVGGGVLEVTLTRLPGDDTVSGIADMVKNVGLNKPKAQDIADTVAGYFVPAVCVLAVATFAAWVGIGVTSDGGGHGGMDASAAAVQAITYAIAVLIVSCPCAIGLAVPMVMVIGGGIAAERGVVIKKATAIEAARHATHVVFDKTGTLTEGKLAVRQETYRTTTTTLRNNRYSQQQQVGRNRDGHVASLALALVKESNHPVAVAVRAQLLAWKVKPSDRVSDVQVVVGNGIEGRYSSDSGSGGPPHSSGQVRMIRIRAGNARWLGVTDDPEVRRFQERKYTVFCVEIDGALAAIYGLRDKVRPEAKQVVRELQARGIAVAIVSGDDLQAVHAVAEELGIVKSFTMSGAKPLDKKEIVRTLLREDPGLKRRKKCRTERMARFFRRLLRREEEEPDAKAVVVFVGDGTNDAGALAEATIGVHMSPSSSAFASSSSSPSPSSPMSSSPVFEISQGAAAVVLTRSDLRGVLVLMRLSQAAMRCVVFNFAWSFFYNIFAVLLDAGAFVDVREDTGVDVRIPPQFAGLGEIASVLPIVGAAWLLRWAKLE